MRVLWISCLLLGIVTTLPIKRGKVSPRSFGSYGPFQPFPHNYEQPYAPPTRKTDGQYIGYNNPSVAGYEGALPVAAPSVPEYGGLYPTMESGAGYEPTGPVVQYVGYPVASNYYDGPAAAFPVYDTRKTDGQYIGYNNPSVAGYEGALPVAAPSVPEYGGLYPTMESGAGYEPTGPGAPVAATHPDGQEVSVAPDSGHYWGSVGGEANEPVFSDVSDLKPVSSFNSRSRYQRGKTVFYEATYVPEEVPVPAETSYTPEEGPVPETSHTPWMGYPTQPIQKRPVMNPVKQHYPPSNAVKRRY